MSLYEQHISHHPWLQELVARKLSSLVAQPKLSSFLAELLTGGSTPLQLSSVFAGHEKHAELFGSTQLAARECMYLLP